MNLSESQDRTHVDTRADGATQGKQKQTNQGQDSNPNNQDQGNVGNATTQQTSGKSDDLALNVVKLQQELAQQCLSDTQSKLSKEDGEDFDKCYVGMQIAMHAGMKSKLTVFSRQASGDFKQLVDQAIQTTDKHLAKAESIMKELDENSNSSSSEDRTSKNAAATEKSEKR